jgi:hypothetical protein
MKLKLSFLLLVISLVNFKTNAQIITELGPDNYRSIQVDWPGYQDYTKNIILLHEIYNGTLISPNFVIGTLTAKRGETGAGNRLSTINLNTSSAYNATYASFQASSSESKWILKTCIFDNKKYLAVEIPYSDACFSQGFYFTGYAKSSGALMKAIPYQVNGQPVNQNILTDILDYNGLLLKQSIYANGLEITSPVAIGTSNLDYPLNVNGTIHSKEVKVDLTGWSDFVFKPDYQLQDLQSLKQYIQKNQHLPDIPNEEEVIKNGILIGDMNKKLLQKVEELTLHLIQKDDELKSYNEKLKLLEQRLIKLEAQKN